MERKLEKPTGNRAVIRIADTQIWAMRTHWIGQTFLCAGAGACPMCQVEPPKSRWYTIGTIKGGREALALLELSAELITEWAATPAWADTDCPLGATCVITRRPSPQVGWDIVETAQVSIPLEAQPTRLDLPQSIERLYKLLPSEPTIISQTKWMEHHRRTLCQRLRTAYNTHTPGDRL